MAISAEQLNIILSARDKEFTKAMERSQRRVEMFAKKSQKSMSTTGKAFANLGDVANKFGLALSAGAVATGFVTAIDNATKLAKELTNLSRISGANVEDFQKFAIAARTVGIEQDKLADILKDVNDKFGDYIATGAGPLADFFDNIAPKVGITADAFRGLSSDQALGLYVKTLQDAGVNQQELTFYMEALASDATALSPLLLNNAEALDAIGSSAQDLGQILDEDLIKRTTALRDRWDQVMRIMTTRFTEFFMTVAVGFDELFNLTDTAKIDDLNDELVNQEKILKSLQNSMETYGAAQQAILNDPNQPQYAIDAAREGIAELEEQIASAGAEYQLIADEIRRLQEGRGMTLPPLVSLDSGNGSGTGGGAAEKVKDVRLEFTKLGEAMDDLDSIASTLESGLEDVFMSALDGAGSFKDAMRSTAQAVIKELFRVLVVQRMVNAAMGFFGMPVSGGPASGGAGRASGGPVQAGQAYTVGEHGREMFVPQTAGRILSVPQTKAALSGGDSVIVNQTINVSTGVQQTVRTEIKSLMPQIAESAKAAVADAKRRGGSYGRAFS
jgi:hypothetical protein